MIPRQAWVTESFHGTASTSSRTEPNSSLVKASRVSSAGIALGGTKERLTAFAGSDPREVSSTATAGKANVSSRQGCVELPVCIVQIQSR